MAEFVADLVSLQAVLNMTEGQIVKVTLHNPDGSLIATLIEGECPEGKTLVGGASIGGTLADEA